MPEIVRVNSRFYLLKCAALENSAKRIIMFLKAPLRHHKS